MPTHTKDADVVDDDRTKSIIPHNLRLRAARTHAPRAPAQLQDHRRLNHKGSACRKHRYFYKTVAANHDSRVCHTHRYLLNYCTRSGASQTPPSTSPGTDERQQAQLLPAHHPISNSDTVTCPAEASSMDPCSA